MTIESQKQEVPAPKPVSYREGNVLHRAMKFKPRKKNKYAVYCFDWKCQDTTVLSKVGVMLVPKYGEYIIVGTVTWKQTGKGKNARCHDMKEAIGKTKDPLIALSHALPAKLQIPPCTDFGDETPEQAKKRFKQVGSEIQYLSGYGWSTAHADTEMPSTARNPIAMFGDHRLDSVLSGFLLSASDWAQEVEHDAGIEDRIKTLTELAPSEEANRMTQINRFNELVVLPHFEYSKAQAPASV